MRRVLIEAKDKSFNAAWVLPTQTREGVKQLVIQFEGEPEPKDVLEELVGLGEIVASKADDQKNVYTGYTAFFSLGYTHDAHVLRLTLEKT